MLMNWHCRLLRLLLLGHRSAVWKKRFILTNVHKEKEKSRQFSLNYNPDKLFPSVNPPVRFVEPGAWPNPVNPVIVGCFIVFDCPNVPNAEVVLPKEPNAGAAEDTVVPNDGTPNPVAGF